MTPPAVLASCLWRLLDNPILAKDLRAGFRRRRFYVAHTACVSVVGLAIALAAFIVAEGARESLTPDQVGGVLFWTFAIAQYFVVLLVFPAFACTSISEERVGQSYDLLITTDLRPWEIVVGKFLVALLHSSTFLLATVPLVCIAFLYGGVSPWAIAGAYAALGFVSVAVTVYGIYISAIARSTALAVILAYASVLVLAVASAALVAFCVEEWRDVRRELVEPILAMDLAWKLRGLGVAGWLVGSLFAYFFLLALNRLKPAGANTSTNVRVFFLVFSAVTILGGLGALVWYWPSTPPHGMAADWIARVGITVSAATLLVTSLLCLSGVMAFSTEFEPTSLRVLRARGRWAGPLLPLRVLYPGGASGSVLSLGWSLVLLSTVAWGLVQGLGLREVGVFMGARGWTAIPLSVAAVWTLLLLFSQTAVFMVRLTGSRVVARLLVVALVLLLFFVPLFGFVLGERSGGIAQGYFLCPPLVVADIWALQDVFDPRWHVGAPSLSAMEEAVSAEKLRLGDAWVPALEYRLRVEMAATGAPLAQAGPAAWGVLGLVLAAARLALEAARRLAAPVLAS
ncbi:MAG: ABC transporter permease [Planctomycetes bacterium]|nr:ABC transporter permease [Planctomycetota bacterium]